jgi:hypothetical protein
MVHSDVVSLAATLAIEGGFLPGGTDVFCLFPACLMWRAPE